MGTSASIFGKAGLVMEIKISNTGSSMQALNKHNKYRGVYLKFIFRVVARFYFILFQALKVFRKILALDSTDYIWDSASPYRDLWTQTAQSAGADIEEIYEGIWLVSKDGKKCRIANHLVELDNPAVLKVAGNKWLTHTLLRKSGLPTPDYKAFEINQPERLREFVTLNSGMFVVKPAVGSSSGLGVTTHLKGYAECCKAAALASLYGRLILVENLVAGEIYRLLVLDGEVISASRRDGKIVVGDGASSVRDLLLRDFRRHGSKMPNLSSDRDLEAMLIAQGLGLDSVPPENQRLVVKALLDPVPKAASEIRAAYTTNVTDLICEEIQDAAVRACAAIGSRFAGVDVICFDPTRPLADTGGVIVEVNTTPGLHHHYGLRGGSAGLDPARKVLAAVLEGSR